MRLLGLRRAIARMGHGGRSEGAMRAAPGITRKAQEAGSATRRPPAMAAARTEPRMDGVIDSREEVLAAAPDAADGRFKVPPIIGLDT